LVDALTSFQKIMLMLQFCTRNTDFELARSVTYKSLLGKKVLQDFGGFCPGPRRKTF
jgi:hypothetical protein